MNAPIKAVSWNQVVSRLRAARPIGGPAIQVIDTASGALISADPTGGFEHPWQLHPIWREEEWRVFIRPGFVNGLDATITIDQDGKSKEIAITEEDRPYLTPSWRNPLMSLGVGASLEGDVFNLPAEGYPKFFETIGVRPADPGSAGVQPYDPQTDEERTKELRACDIVLITPRIATNQQVEIHDPLSESQTVTISTVLNNAYASSVKSKYRLVALPKWKPLQEPTAMDRLMGTAEEPQTDEIKIATLWMVSPSNPENGEESEPDGSWVAYPQYDVFWNLAHASRRAVTSKPPDPITLRTGLIGGMADAIFASLLAPVNDAYDKIHAFLNATTFKGEFWTI